MSLVGLEMSANEKESDAESGRLFWSYDIVAVDFGASGGKSSVLRSDCRCSCSLAPVSGGVGLLCGVGGTLVSDVFAQFEGQFLAICPSPLQRKHDLDSVDIIG